MSRLRTSLLSLSALAAAGSLTLLVAPAGATPKGAVPEPPVSGDVRATAYAGNIKDGDCATAGLAGSAVSVTATTDASNTYVTITAVPAGTTLTGVVVKGGPAYNVYVGDHRTDLHAPLRPSGKPAGVSHWFACGTSPSPTSSPTSPSPTPSETSPSPSPTSPSPSVTSPSPTPSGTPTVTPSEPGTPTATPTTPVAPVVPPTASPSVGGPGVVPPAPTGPGLALTGSSTAAIGGLGIALLLAGLALLTVPAVRRRLLG